MIQAIVPELLHNPQHLPALVDGCACGIYPQRLGTRPGEAIRELGRHYRDGAGRLKDGEDRGEAPACLMSVSASTTWQNAPAQFIAVCSSSIRAETLGYAVSFSRP